MFLFAVSLQRKNVEKMFIFFSGKLSLATPFKTSKIVRRGVAKRDREWSPDFSDFSLIFQIS